MQSLIDQSGTSAKVEVDNERRDALAEASKSKSSFFEALEPRRTIQQLVESSASLIGNDDK